MKYIKTYEELDQDQPKIGDYVICNEITGNNQLNDDEFMIKSFISKNIGQIVDFRTKDNISSQYDTVENKYSIFVQYEDLPDEIYDDFDYHTNIDYCRIFNINEIIHWSENKDELEEILEFDSTVNKYNL